MRKSQLQRSYRQYIVCKHESARFEQSIALTMDCVHHLLDTIFAECSNKYKAFSIAYDLMVCYFDRSKTNYRFVEKKQFLSYNKWQVEHFLRTKAINAVKEAINDFTADSDEDEMCQADIMDTLKHYVHN